MTKLGKGHRSYGERYSMYPTLGELRQLLACVADYPNDAMVDINIEEDREKQIDITISEV